MSPMTKIPLTIEYALLGVLRRQPMHGYELHRHLSSADALGTVWHMPQNRLYALLGRLEEEGYVTSQAEQPTNRPTRKVFHITKPGEEAFHQWVKRPVQQGRKVRLEFLVKLFFACQSGNTAAIALIEQQKQECISWVIGTQSAVGAENPGTSYLMLVQQFRIGQIEAMISWLDYCRAALSEKV
jgi:PadR family transcriptional regulator AphA